MLPRLFHCQSIKYAGIPPEMFGCGSTDTFYQAWETFSGCNKFILFLALTLISFCSYLSLHVCLAALKIRQNLAHSSIHVVLGEAEGQNRAVTAVFR